MAFAGIITFGTLQVKAEESGKMSKHHYVVLGAAIGSLAFFRFIVSAFRHHLMFNSSTRASGPGSEGLVQFKRVPLGEEVQDDETLQDEIREAINEAENDACSLIVGFLICQLAVWKCTGHLMPLHPPEGHHEGHSVAQIGQMALCFGIALVLLGIFANIERAFKNRIKNVPKSSVWKIPLANFADSTTLTCLMTACWLALIASTWQVSCWLHPTPVNSHEMAEVATAFVLTVLSVICILLLDRAADQLKDKSSSVGSKEWDEMIAKVLRKLIEAFGVLVGLCWEKACHGAMDTMIESTPALDEHKVISKLGAAVLLASYILPAWFWHILPMANKDITDHRTAINVALLHRLHREKRTHEVFR